MTISPFKDNVVLITGASVGIGRELAFQLADQGAALALAARRQDALQEVAAQCRQRGARVLAVTTDVTQEAECRRMVEATVEEYGRLDTLVVNAGVSQWADFDAMQTLEPYRVMAAVNLLGSVYCAYFALPHLKRTRGRLVGVSSLAGKTGVPTRSGYSATKHAQVGFFDSLRIELADTGVTVTMIYPGFVQTGIRERAFGADGKPLGRGNSPVRETEAMPVEECVRIMIRAMARRQREEVMTLRGKFGQWIKLIAPGLVDRIARRAIETGR